MNHDRLICCAFVAMLVLGALLGSPFKAVKAQTGAPVYTDASTGLPTDGQYSYVMCADMNQDGKFDIISGADKYPSASTHGLYVWTGDGTGHWTKNSAGLPTDNDYGGTAMADLNKDAKMDLIASYETWSGGSAKGIGVWLGNGGVGGSLTFTAGISPTTKDGYDSVYEADVNADGNSDIIAGSHGVGLKVWLGNGGAGGTLSWTEKDSGLPTSGEYTGVTAGDVNGDGRYDIAAGNYNGDGVQVWTQNPDGSWTENSTGLFDKENSFGVVFGYFDKDRSLDLAATVRDHGVYVWLGNGGAGGKMNWTESRAGLPTTGDYKEIDAGDMDYDLNTDLVVAEVDNGIGVYDGNGGAGGSLSFTDVSSGLPTSGSYYGATFCHINDDWYLDLVGSTWGSGLKAWTMTLGPPDTTPPAKIPDLAAEVVDYKSARLTWTAVGDNGNTGTAKSYDVRYSSTQIQTLADFNASFKAPSPPMPKASGQKETFIVLGLSANTTYYFAVIASDAAGNRAPLSNIATIKTLPPPANPKPPVLVSIAPANGTTVKGIVHIAVAFSDLDNDVNEVELYLDGNKIDSNGQGSSPYYYNWDTMNGSLKVPNGDHQLKVIIRDQAGLQATGYSTVKVSNKSTTKPKKGFIPGFEGLALLAALGAALSLLGKGKRK